MEKLKQSKFVSYMNEKMNMRIFWILIAGICVLAVAIWVFFGSLDTDMFFMLASGDEILDNGIPYKNIWCIDKNADIVLQQWLYCVILSFFAKYGVFSCFLLSFLTFGIFALIIKIFFNIKECKNGGVYFLCLCFLASFSAYMFKLRPQTATLIILMIECCGLELFKKTNHKRWLYLLPLSMLLEINIHASMWPMHYAILLAYFVPSVSKQFINDDSLFKYKKTLILPVLLMIGAMFVNPYGVNGPLYIVKSMMSGALGLLPIKELAEPTYFSVSTATLVVLLFSVVVLCKCKKLNSVTLYITLGIAFMSIMKVRNNMFNSIPLIYLFIDLHKAYISQDKLVIDWKKDIKRYLYPFFVIAYLLMFISISDLFNDILGTEDTQTVLRNGDVTEISQHFNEFNYDDNFELIADYIRENDCYHDKIFTGFNTGAYLEYVGCDNVFIDARPEIYHYKLNGSNDFISEYITLISPPTLNAGVCKLAKSSENYNDFVKAFTDKYQFDYAVIDANLEEVVYGMYLEESGDYELVEEVSTKDYYFYKKIK